MHGTLDRISRAALAVTEDNVMDTAHNIVDWASESIPYARPMEADATALRLARGVAQYVLNDNGHGTAEGHAAAILALGWAVSTLPEPAWTRPALSG